MKRAFDLIVSAGALVVALPLIGVLAIAIRRDSPGAALFRQTRIGRDGTPFTCLKLRTMRQGSPEVPTHLSPADHVTPLGHRLRRWKLDELPQLLNVLAGDMSLVGPRPCLPSQVELIEERRRRGVLALRPGITGPAQLQGVDMSDPARLAAIDATYVGRAGLFNDLAILVRTFSGRAFSDRIGE